MIARPQLGSIAYGLLSHMHAGGRFNGKTILLLGRKNKAKLEELQLSAAGSLVMEILLDVSFHVWVENIVIKVKPSHHLCGTTVLCKLVVHVQS
jgi:hypothetical protein